MFSEKFSFLTCFLLLSFLMLATNLASSLYPIYKNLNILTSFQITIVFSAYIAGLVPSLFVSQWVLNKIGLRNLLFTSIVINVLGLLLMGCGESFISIFIGRVLQGISIGISASNLAFSLIAFEPNKNYHRASLATGFAMTIGGGCGPISSAFISINYNSSLLAPYVIISIFLLLLSPFLYFIKNLKNNTKFSLPKIPSEYKHVFYICSFAAFLCWSVTAMFLSLIPVSFSFLLEQNKFLSLALTASLILLFSGVTQVFSVRFSIKLNIILGMLIMLVSSILLCFSQLLGLYYLLLLCSILAGVGHGLSFLGITRLLNGCINNSLYKGQIITAYNIAIYLGVGVPALLMGVLTKFYEINIAIIFFSFYMFFSFLFCFIKIRKHIS